MPWQLYIHHYFPKEAAWESQYNLKHIFEALEGHTGSIFYHIVRMPRFFGEIIFIPISWFFLIIFKRKNHNALVAIAIWLILPYLFFSLVATKMPAYVMISAPAIFLIQAYFFWELKDSEFKIKYKKLSVVILLLLFLLPVRYCLERTKPFKNYDRNPKWAKEPRTLEEKILSTNYILFNIDRPIEAMFYSPYTVYPFIPTENQIQQLDEKGYKVVIYDTDVIPANIQKNN